jgi:predicted nucleic acid-binding protein
VSRRAIADTSVFVARETNRPLRPYEEEDLEIAVSIVTVAELEMGVLAAVETRIRAAGLGWLGVQDAWIAATAIAHDAELLTQDADFDAVPSLRVIKL